MATVIKRDGTEERFDNEKLINSMKKAGLDEATASEIAEGVSFEIRDEEVSTEDIRAMVEEDMKYYRSAALKSYGRGFT